MKHLSLNKIILPGILLTLLVIRIFLYYLHLPKFSSGTKIRISARVTSEPVGYSDSQYIKVMGFKTYLPLYPKVYYGDRIILEGEVEGDKLKKPKLVKIYDNRSFLYGFRQKLIGFYERSFPKDHAALVAGVVIGSKSGIGEELWEKLKNSGTAHVVVASGMNVSMVANFLLSALILFIPRRKAVFVALVGVWSYAVLSGFDAPIVRASVMGSIAFIAVGTGRMYLTLRSLFITALVLLFVKPVWVSDLGFWLSAVATFSIIVFYPKINKFFFFVPEVVKENWSTTLSAQIGVVPILYYYFGQLSLLSPLINVAVLWTVVLITIIGMIAGIIGTIYEPLGRMILYLCYPLTGWFLFVVSLF